MKSRKVRLLPGDEGVATRLATLNRYLGPHPILLANRQVLMAAQLACEDALAWLQACGIQVEHNKGVWRAVPNEECTPLPAEEWLL
jgi:hypothetical protein